MADRKTGCEVVKKHGKIVKLTLNGLKMAGMYCCCFFFVVVVVCSFVFVVVVVVASFFCCLF